MATEEDVGISCYMNSVPGFSGILKQRYSDFIVNEISSDGTIIHLSSLVPPPDEVNPKGLADPEKTGTGFATGFVSEKDGPGADIKGFRELVGQNDAENLKILLAKISAKELKDLEPVLLAPDADKAHRAAVHDFFKSKLPFLVSDTVDGSGDFENTKRIRIRYFPGGGKKRDRGWKSSNPKRHKGIQWGENMAPLDTNERDNCSVHLPRFLLFHLYKENKTTQDALLVIGRKLGIQPKAFGFAGTKDKRAVTTQQVTVFKQSAATLASLNSRLFGIKAGNFRYVQESLGLGELCGNHFTITLRNVVSTGQGAIADAAEHLKQMGFVNYYGLQRFGNSPIPTHTVGAALLRGDWKMAVDLLLQPRDGEVADIAAVRQAFKESGDVNVALRDFPRKLGSERAVLGGLKKNPENWLMAFNSIPRPMRLMFVHSYQSYLWNHAASYRLKTYGVERAVEGDLVYCKEVERDCPSTNLEKSPSGSRTEASCGDEMLEDAEEFVFDYASEGEKKVKLVTADDVAADKYTIDDVVLPLPGSSIMYPGNSTANVYQQLASKDLVDLASKVHSQKDYSIVNMSGGYRCLVQKLKDFQWKLLTYDDATLPLSTTDWDAIVERARKEDDEPLPSRTTSVNSGGRVREALQLRFTLPASSYATMAMRELLKSSTSVAYHKTLNEEGGDRPQ